MDSKCHPQTKEADSFIGYLIRIFKVSGGIPEEINFNAIFKWYQEAANCGQSLNRKLAASLLKPRKRRFSGMRSSRRMLTVRRADKRSFHLCWVWNAGCAALILPTVLLEKCVDLRA